MDSDKFYTATYVAQVASVSYTTVVHACIGGKLPNTPIYGPGKHRAVSALAIKGSDALEWIRGLPNGSERPAPQPIRERTPRAPKAKGDAEKSKEKAKPAKPKAKAKPAKRAKLEAKAKPKARASAGPKKVARVAKAPKDDSAESQPNE